MANYREDIVDIELTGGNIHRSFAKHAIGGGDEAANRFGIRTFRNGEPENISGNCFGLFIRADGETVAINNGTVSGNVAYVTLPSACYAVEGCFSLAIKVTGTNMTGTMRIVDGVVDRTSTDTPVDPGTILPTIDDLIEAINEAVASIPSDYTGLLSDIAPEYSSEKTYPVVGTITWYNGQLKRSIVQITSPESFDPAHWENAEISNEFIKTNNNVKNIADIVNMIDHSEYSDKYHTQQEHTSESGNTWSFSDNVFNAGYVKTISLYITGSTNRDVSVVILDANTRKVLYVRENIVSGYGIVEAGINTYIPVPFILGVRAYKQGFKTGWGVAAVLSNDTTFEVGETVSLSFEYTFGYSYKVNYSGERFLKLTAVGDRSHDFNNTVYAGNIDAFFGCAKEVSDLLNAPEGTEYGYWYLSCRVMANNSTNIYICQTAYSFDSGIIGKTALYRRYLIISKSTWSYTNLDQASAVWRRINYFPGRQEISDENEYYSPIAFSEYPNNTDANAFIYINNYVYPVGFVNSIKSKVNGNTSSEIKFYIINAENGNVMRVYSATGTGELFVDVGEYIGVPFYIGVGGTHASYKAEAYSVRSLNYLTFSATVKMGETVTLSFAARTSSESVFSIAQEVQYSGLKSTVYDVVPVKTHNRLFAAGDSITAGYPHCNAGEHWWETVARTLGFTAESGAISGSGMAYWKSGMNACRVAHDTDFTKYDVVIFAYGTNDYGNDIPIGEITDEYTYNTSVTPSFYGAVKYVIDTVLTENPSANLIFALPINRKDVGTFGDNWAFGTTNGVGKTLSDYCDAIINVCNLYGINYIDRRHSVFNAYTIDTLLTDNLHPTRDGYRILGAEMAARVGAIIKPFEEYDGNGGIPYPTP